MKRAVDTIYKYQHLDRRAKKQLKGRFLDYLRNIQLIEIMTGNTLKDALHTQQLEGIKSGVARGSQNEDGEKDISSEGNTLSKIDISCLMQPPVNMLRGRCMALAFSHWLGSK